MVVKLKMQANFSFKLKFNKQKLKTLAQSNNKALLHKFFY